MKTKIKSLLIPITHLPDSMCGYANGYVGIPEGHPWFNVNYDYIDCDVHGGLTYAGDHAPKHEPDGLYWIGFDTCHDTDNKQNCDKTYCEQQLAKLLQQAKDAVI